MRDYEPERIYNVGIFGHVGSGKTTLVEAMLYAARAIPRPGRVEDGTTTSDYDLDEHRHQMSIHLSVTPLEWKERKINLIDVPGYADFAGDMAAAMHVVDGAIIVVDATAGVEVGTEQAWQLARAAGVNVIFFVNKCDRENANFLRCVDQIRELLDEAATPLYLPLGVARSFRGLISLRQGIAYPTAQAHDGGFGEEHVPSEQDAEMHTWRTALLDKIAATSDDLIEKYLEHGEDALSPDERLRGLQLGIAQHTIVPVLCGSGLDVTGIAQLLKAIIEVVPPAAQRTCRAIDLNTGTAVDLTADRTAPLAALVFKSLADPYGKISFFRVYQGTLHTNNGTRNARTGKDERCAHLYIPHGKDQESVERIGAGDIGVTTKLVDTLTNDTLCAPEQPLQITPIQFPQPSFTAVVKPHGRSDLDKLSGALQRMLEEDPTLHTSRDDVTGETLLSGLGESHLAIVAERMKRKFDTSVDIELPRIPYRETIRGTAEASYRHKKQSGGAGQFADVTLRVEPLPPDPSRTDPLEFINAIVGGVISKGFMPAIEKGIREAMAEGVLVGSPIVDVRVSVIDGKEHPVDSKEIAFKIAGAQAFKIAVQQAMPTILEPYYTLEIDVPDQYAGDVMSDMSTRRGRVLGMLPSGAGRTVVTAQVPLAECQRYDTDLRSMTHGRGSFTMRFEGYEDVPAHIAQQLSAAYQQELETV